MLKKVFIAVSLIALMGTAAFAQEPATTAKPKQETHQVAHKHHHRKATKKTSSKKEHATKKTHATKAKKADSTATQAH